MPMPNPEITVEVLDSNKWRLSWSMDGASRALYRLSRPDTGWRSSLFIGHDSTDMPVSGTFEAGVTYQFWLGVAGDEIKYTGSNTQTITLVAPSGSGDDEGLAAGN